MAGLSWYIYGAFFIGMVFIDAEFRIAEWFVPAENELLGCF